MRLTMVLMPTADEQRQLGYSLVIDPAVADFPNRIPLWQGDNFLRPAIGWATNIHVDAEGRLVGDVEMDEAYRDHMMPGLNWSPSASGRTTLWGASLFPVQRTETDDA